MNDGEGVCVLIPTLNEAATIGHVIDGFLDIGVERIIVIDGNSSDDTVVIAREHGAEVHIQRGSGKGRAVREGLSLIDRPYIILVDGDGTYQPTDARKLLTTLKDSPAQHVIGDRFADIRPGAMTRLNWIGNRLINRVFTALHGRDFADILSGYRAFCRTSVDEMDLTSAGFGIETEMAVECVRRDIPTSTVEISYLPRSDDSSTNLRPIRDGVVIVSTLWRLLRTTNPLLYFGTMGVVTSMLAVFVGSYVVIEWFVRGIPHQVLAMVAVFGLLFGFQLLAFGILTDMILKLYR